jgi:hypothetical protein
MQKEPDYTSEVLRFASDEIHKIQEDNSLWEYKIKIVLLEKDRDPTDENRSVVATIIVDNEYLTATIEIGKTFLDKFIRKEYDELTNALCHEVAHIYTTDLHNMAQMRYITPPEIKIAAERLTERIGRRMHEILKLKEELKNKNLNANPKNTRRNKKSK